MSMNFKQNFLNYFVSFGVPETNDNREFVVNI